LGLSPDAEIEVVRAAHRVLARKYHPDLNLRPDAQRQMRDINWAKDELEQDLAKWRAASSTPTTGARKNPPPTPLTQQQFAAYGSAIALIVTRANSAILVHHALAGAVRKDPDLAQASIWKAAMTAVADEYDAVAKDTAALTCPSELSTMGQNMQRWASGHTAQSRRIREALAGKSGSSLRDPRDIRENNELRRKYRTEQTRIARLYGFTL
jgi:hypothetical protein